MRRFALASLLILIATQPVFAGAWLHDKGRGFYSASATFRTVSAATDHEIGIYAEYGLTSRLNIGLDIYETPGFEGHALLFVRLPIVRPENRNKIALELALGGHRRETSIRPMYRMGLSWGYGFSNRFGPGWLAVDTAIEYREGASEPLFKLDATIGLSSSDGIRPLLQIETAIAKDLPLLWRVTPSLMIPSKGKATWVVGIQQRSFGTPRTGLKVALWRRF